VKLVRAALGDRGNLQTARPAVFGLEAARQHFHLRDRVDVGQQLDRVASVSVAPMPSIRNSCCRRRRGGRCWWRWCLRPSPREQRQAEERPALDGQILDGLRGTTNDRSPPETNRRRFGRDFDRFRRAAHFERQHGDGDAVAGTDGHAGALEVFEAAHRGFERIRIGGDVGEHEIARHVGDDRRRRGAA
jgi:hypothetical protein